jgi:membrane-associated phospholipid phosphatase
MQKSLFFLFTFLLIFNYSIAQDADGDSPNSKHEKWEFVLESSGDILQLALPITAGIMTLIEKDYQGTKKFAFSYTTAMVLTYSLKEIVHKQRPEGRVLFDSFPSGHTASAFSGASFIQRRYGWKYGKYAYVLAGVVGLSRMEGPDGWHDIWDVLGGAAIGIGSTYLFTKPYQKEKIDVGFASDGNNYLLSFRYRF